MISIYDLNIVLLKRVLERNWRGQLVQIHTFLLQPSSRLNSLHALNLVRLAKFNIAHCFFCSQIHWKSANCHYRRPDVFTSSQWQTDLGSASWYYVTYRALVSVFVFVNFCVYLASMSKVQRDFFFIYLTSQGLLLLTAHQLLDLGLTVAAFVKQSSDPSFRRK